jgi:hypothetical protein
MKALLSQEINLRMMSSKFNLMVFLEIFYNLIKMRNLQVFLRVMMSPIWIKEIQILLEKIQSIFFKNQLVIKEAFHKFIEIVNLITLINQEREKLNC